MSLLGSFGAYTSPAVETKEQSGVENTTVPGAFFARADAEANLVALRRKTLGLWEELTWRDYRRGVRAVAAALIDSGVQAGEAVGLISENRVEWLFADLGILSTGAVTCAMYTTSAVAQIEYITTHIEAEIVPVLLFDQDMETRI